MSELQPILNRVAVIDCGTNTFNLLVADPREDGGWDTVYQTKLAVKIGEGSFEKAYIQPARFARGLDALLCYKKACTNYECSQLFAYGTSALRDSSNGQEFIEMGSKILGAPIHLIDGEEEAALIFNGVKITYPIVDETVLIMDIGGGSTEFVIANEEGVLWKRSFALGVSRLYDTIRPSDPIQREEIQTLNQFLHTELSSLNEALSQFQPTRLIGSSGSFDTLLDLYFVGVKQEKPKDQTIHRIPIHVMQGLNDQLLLSTYDQRLRNPVIPEMRAQFMPLASALVDYVLHMHTFQEIIHSAYSLKEGALARLLEQHK
jgi:exopolyphosphatase / guanosine-5'-triphosphate,3'-diphosphate pyrophosphatase